MTSKVYSWTCLKCGKVIESLHEGQFKFNKKIHESTCGLNKGEKKDEN